MKREFRAYAALVLICVWFTLALLSALPAHADGCRQTGIASWYGWEAGDWTANGERWNPNGMTAAHRTLAFGTVVRVTHSETGRSVVVTINDRGPALWTGRVIDLSQAAARSLGFERAGLAHVCITY